jgi:hypothetical protein
MCPACISTLAVMVAGAVSSGGVLAVVVSKFREMSGMSDPNSSVEQENQKEEIWEKQRTSK